MSRLLLSNSNAAIQRAAAVSGSGSNATTTAVAAALRAPSLPPQPAVSNHHQISRRWKSLLIHANRQQQAHRQLSTPTSSSFSPAQTINARCSRVSSNLYVPKYCRALSTSVVDQSSKMPSSGSASKCLQLDNINPNFITMEYAVRGPLVIRAGEIEKELKQVCVLFWGRSKRAAVTQKGTLKCYYALWLVVIVIVVLLLLPPCIIRVVSRPWRISDHMCGVRKYVVFCCCCNELVWLYPNVVSPPCTLHS